MGRAEEEKKKAKKKLDEVRENSLEKRMKTDNENTEDTNKYTRSNPFIKFIV